MTLTATASVSHWHLPRWRTFVVAVLIGLGLAAVGAGYVLLFHPAPVTLRFPVWVVPLAGLLFVPLEEYVFRGVVLRWTARWCGLGCGLVVSATAFAAFHLDWPRFPARFLAGLVLGLLYWRTRSLWPCFVAHYVHNASLAVIVLLARGTLT
jgi:membrane protease YdiL (CAAX protease family)